MVRYPTVMVDLTHPIAALSAATRGPNSTRGRVYEHKVALYNKIGYGPHRCHWCHTPLTWAKGTKQGVLITDHVNGIRNDNSPSNLVPACSSCNTMRQRNRYRPTIQDDELFVTMKDGHRARADWCTCQECGERFLASTARIKRGTVKVCSRRCSNAISLRKRWGGRS